jgi:hypothetical protein
VTTYQEDWLERLEIKSECKRCCVSIKRRTEGTTDVLQSVEYFVTGTSEERNALVFADGDRYRLNEMFIFVSCFITLRAELPSSTVCFVTFFPLQFIVLYVF